MKRILYVLSYAATFALGGIVSYRIGVTDHMGDISRNVEESTELSALVYSNLLLMLVESNGTPSAYRDTLISQLALLDQLKVKNGTAINARSIELSKLLTHLKLADVEHLLGNESDAKKHLSLATESCRSSGLNDCSLVAVRSLQEKVLVTLSRLRSAN